MTCSNKNFGKTLLLLAVALLTTVSNSVPGMAQGLEALQTANVEPTADPGLRATKELFRRPATIPFPEHNPYSPQKMALGKLLYFDTRLSSSNMLSCASCHNPGFGWGDGMAKGKGDSMRELGRRTPTILNAAWSDLLFWDGRAETLEEQALGPIVSEAEMAMPLDRLIATLRGIEGYRTMFAKAFPFEGITPRTVGMALATYERTIVSSRAPFDQWIEGDESAISADAKRGFELFVGKARCAQCHSGWNMTDNSFHDIGLTDGDLGRGELMPDIEVMRHAFKTPGLRDLGRRAPYMHDGSIETLREVIAHYDSGGVERPSLSPEMQPLGLTEKESDELLAFLETLTGDLAPVVLPVLPR